jgi:hypothetical protein
MALDTFVFVIVVPPDADGLPLFKEISAQMSRYIGLSDDQTAEASGLLNRLVGERLQAGAPVEVTFERPYGDGPLTVDIVGAALPGDDSLAVDGVTVSSIDGSRSRLRLSWNVRD